MSVPDPATTDWVPLQGAVPTNVEYWGAWSAAQTYNDGDCAIASNGILYMCTTNGTTSAPPTWPGAAGPQGAIGPQGVQGAGIPTPVVNGQWVKGVGGVAVWSALAVADLIPANPMFVSAPAAYMPGPWPKTWPTVTLPFKANVVLSVSATVYTGAAGGPQGFKVQWDGGDLPCYGDMYFNEASSHKPLTVHNMIVGAAAGAHTITVAYAGGSMTSDSGDRATYLLVAQAVP